MVWMLTTRVAAISWLVWPAGRSSRTWVSRLVRLPGRGPWVAGRGLAGPWAAGAWAAGAWAAGAWVAGAWGAGRGPGVAARAGDGRAAPGPGPPRSPVSAPSPATIPR